MSRGRVPYSAGNAAYKAAFDAAFPGLPHGMEMPEAEARITAALIAYDGVRWSERAEWEQHKRIEAAVEQLQPVLLRFAEGLAEEMRAVGAAAERAGEVFRRALPAFAQDA
jgi:hypothetical protein